MDYFDYFPFFHIFDINSAQMMNKQERHIVHLELQGKHYYFGSIKALCDHFGKQDIGIKYKSLANFGITPEKPFTNRLCIIRKGTLVTAPKNE